MNWLSDTVIQWPNGSVPEMLTKPIEEALSLTDDVEMAFPENKMCNTVGIGADDGELGQELRSVTITMGPTMLDEDGATNTLPEMLISSRRALRIPRAANVHKSNDIVRGPENVISVRLAITAVVVE